MKFEKEFREAHPETIGETDRAFDESNYTDWMEKQYSELLASLTERMNTIKSDERMSYNPDQVFSNAPLALIQHGMLQELNLIEGILNIPLSKIPITDRFSKSKNITKDTK